MAIDHEAFKLTAHEKAKLRHEEITLLPLDDNGQMCGCACYLHKSLKLKNPADLARAGPDTLARGGRCGPCRDKCTAPALQSFLSGSASCQRRARRRARLLLEVPDELADDLVVKSFCDWLEVEGREEGRQEGRE